MSRENVAIGLAIVGALAVAGFLKPGVLKPDLLVGIAILGCLAYAASQGLDGLRGLWRRRGRP